MIVIGTKCQLVETVTDELTAAHVGSGALPVFGTGTVLLPWAVLCCLEGNFPKGIALTALYLVIWLVRSIMEPKLMAKSAGLPPLPALMAMYVGFCAMGVAGMILGPILLLLVKQLHDGGYLHLWK